MVILPLGLRGAVVHETVTLTVVKLFYYKEEYPNKCYLMVDGTHHTMDLHFINQWRPKSSQFNSSLTKSDFVTVSWNGQELILSPRWCYNPSSSALMAQVCMRTEGWCLEGSDQVLENLELKKNRLLLPPPLWLLALSVSALVRPVLPGVGGPGPGR